MPERIFTVVRNSYSTASITPGQWVSYDIVTDKDGVGVTKPGGANRGTAAGVVAQAMTPGAYGLVQAWGYCEAALCLGGSGSLTSKITAGRPLGFMTSHFAAQALPRTTAVAKSDFAKRIVGIGIEPLNTAALATHFGTAGFYEVLIRCL
jgi:hypothetical protein